MVSIGWFRWPYRLLLIVSLLLFGVYCLIFLLFPQIDTLLTWTGRLSASLLSAYLTSIFVDGVFREQQRKREEWIRKVALAELTQSLQRQQALIEKLYKAAISERPPSNEFENLDELVKSDKFEEIRMVDLCGTAPIANRSDNYRWIDEAYQIHKELVDNINKTINKYSIVLDADLIEELHRLTNGDYGKNINSYSTLIEFRNQDKGPMLLYDIFYKNFYGFIEDLSSVCDKVGEDFESYELDVLYADNIAPSVGKNRIVDDVPFEVMIHRFQKDQEEQQEKLRREKENNQD